MTNLDRIFKRRDIALSTKILLVKAMVFPVVMYGCESWTIKKSWALKNRCSWTVALERTPVIPLDCKEIQPVHPKGNQSWIFIGRTDAEAETPILGPLMRRADSFEKTLMLGKIEGKRRCGRLKMRWLDGITDSTNMGLGELRELVMPPGRPGVLQFMGLHRVTHNWPTELNWDCFFFNLLTSIFHTIQFLSYSRAGIFLLHQCLSNTQSLFCWL